MKPHDNPRVGRWLMVLALAITFLQLLVATLSAREQTGSATGSGAFASVMPAEQFNSSVPAEKPTGKVLDLSLARAMELGLANNLGLLLSREGVNSARGRQWVGLSRLLPNITTSASYHYLKESLAITGITLPNVPAVVGPFHFYDARILLSQRLFDWEAIKRNSAARHELSAAEFSLKDAREVVVVAVGAAYLEALAGSARVETIGRQVVTARTILDRAVELHKAGVSPGIDELRARVEFLSRSQRLIVARNELEKQKLGLIRVIGLPVAQEIRLQERLPYPPFTSDHVEQVVPQALRSRDDYQAALHLLKSAEASRQAAGAQRFPALVLDADYGVTGIDPNSLYGTFHIVGSLKMPIFEGGRIHGDLLQAEARVRQRNDELRDLASKIEFEVRTALLDVGAATRQLEVAKETVQLAELALYQAQERFSAGINDNLEVVQAQEAVATAHEEHISSQYQYDLARLLLAKARGVAEGTAGLGDGE